MEKIEALAKYLDCDVEDITQGYDDDHFEYGDQEYLVCDDYDDAVEKAKESFLNLVDDLGGEIFGISSLNNIIERHIDEDWFEDAFREDEENYIYDIEDESDSKYENRLIAEMVERGILDEDEDFEYSEDDENQEYPILKDDVDLDAKKEEFIQEYIDRIDDFVEEFKFNFGEDYLYKMIEQNNLVDWYAVADEVIGFDGPANELAGYDGQEIELEDGYYAFRQN